MNTVEIQFSELVVTVFVFPAKGLWSNFAAYLFQTKLTIFSNSTCPFCREKEAFAVEKINITVLSKSKFLKFKRKWPFIFRTFEGSRIQKTGNHTREI